MRFPLIIARSRDIFLLFFLNFHSYSHSFTFSFSVFIVTRSWSLFNLNISLLVDWIVWSFTNFWFRFIVSRSRQFFWYLVLMSCTYSYTFTFLNKLIIFTRARCLFYPLVSLLIHWVLRSFSKMSFSFIISRSRNIFLFFFLQSHPNSYSFALFSSFFIVSRSWCLLNFYISLLIYGILRSFNNFRFVLVISRTWHFFNLSFCKLLSHRKPISFFIETFVVTWTRSLLYLIITFLINWVLWPFYYFRSAFIISRSWHFFLFMFRISLPNSISLSCFFRFFILSRSWSRFKLLRILFINRILRTFNGFTLMFIISRSRCIFRSLFIRFTSNSVTF